MSAELHEDWHLAAAKELEARVKNRDFFVRVAVDPEQAAKAGAGPGDLDGQAWEEAAQGAERWLEGIDPEAVDLDDLPEYEVRRGETPIVLAAIPKKPKRRGTDPLIVNPYPGVAVFTGSYTTGPPPVFDDGT